MLSMRVHKITHGQSGFMLPHKGSELALRTLFIAAKSTEIARLGKTQVILAKDFRASKRWNIDKDQT